MQININSDDPIDIREWVQMHAAGVNPRFETEVSVTIISGAESLEKRGFFKLLADYGGYRKYELTPEGLAFFNFIRNITPR